MGGGTGKRQRQYLVASSFGLRSGLRQSGSGFAVQTERPKAEALGYLEATADRVLRDGPP
jgi:hypothetical protein